MTDDPATIALLTQIRDLLIPVAHGYREKYEEHLSEVRRGRAVVLQRLVRGGKPLDACKLMNGELSRGEIVGRTSIDRGDMSRLLAALKENNLLESEDDACPKLIFTLDEIEKMYVKR